MTNNTASGLMVTGHDNHLFFPVTGPSAPAEYEPAQHVDPAVINDIVTWLTARG